MDVERLIEFTMADHKRFFQCVTGTADGRLNKGSVYRGTVLYAETKARSGTYARVQVLDDLGQVMTFDPVVFKEISNGAGSDNGIDRKPSSEPWV